MWRGTALIQALRGRDRSGFRNQPGLQSECQASQGHTMRLSERNKQANIILGKGKANPEARRDAHTTVEQTPGVL